MHKPVARNTTTKLLLVCPSWLAIWQVWVCSCLQGIFQHLGLPWISWGLRSVLGVSLSKFDIWSFTEEAPTLPMNSCFTVNFRANCWGFSFAQYYGGIQYCWWVVSRFQTGYSLEGSDMFLRVPLMFQYLLRFRIGMICDCKWRPRKYAPRLLI